MAARRPQSSSPDHPADFFLLAAWIGLLTGFAELAVLGIRKYVKHNFLNAGPDVLWLTPASYVFFLLVVGMLFWLGARRWPRRFSMRVAIGVYVFLGSLSLLLLLLFPRIHSIALVLLAAGLGVQTSRMLSPRLHGALYPVIRYSTAALTALTIALGLSVRVRRAAIERQALATLPSPPQGAPNVLLLILDTVRAANLSLYGYSAPTTPELERWAKTGVQFNLAISSAPWTTPSHASMFSGLHAHEVARDWRARLAEGTPTLAEVLSRAGYRTAGFTANPGRTGYEVGLDRGFVHFEDYVLEPRPMLTSTSLGRAIQPWLVDAFHINPTGVRDADQISAALLRWLRRPNQRPFFIFANFLDAHEPYFSPKPYRELFGAKRQPWWHGRHSETPLTQDQARPAIDAYNAAIAYLDSRIGGILTELERQGLAENTIVILTADHGEAFAEHGLQFHGHSVYRHEVRVPLVISWPGRIPAGREIDAPVSLRDLPATICDLLQLRDGHPFPGRSLARHWRDSAPVEPDTVLSSVRRVTKQPAWLPVSGGDLYAVVFDGLWYIRNAGSGREELYDVVRDSLEQHDLSQSERGRQALPRFRNILQSLAGGDMERRRRRAVSSGPEPIADPGR